MKAYGSSAVTEKKRGNTSSHGEDTVGKIVARVKDIVVGEHLLKRGDRVIIGVSGGADSVVLLDILRRLKDSLGISLYVVHVDHRLRMDSCADARFVQEQAERFQVPAVIEGRDVRALCHEAGWSLEEGARRIRYDCFLEVARRYSACVIALAHTADDQAETVLMRLMRGSGLTGLGGIPIERVQGGIRIVRPLLHVWRDEVMAYCEEAGLSHRHDPTNEDLYFVRNRIRHELLPMLERFYNPNMKMALMQLAEQSRTDNEYLQLGLQRVWKRVAKISRHGEVELLIRTLVRQPKALQRALVREAIRCIQGDLNKFEFRHWMEVEQLFGSLPVGSVVSLPGGIRVNRQRERVVFCIAQEF